MKNIYENRFLVWLMWLVPIACTGWLSVIIWTIIQAGILGWQSSSEKEFKKPVKERGVIMEMNKDKNLTLKEKEILKNNKNFIKIGEGVFLYERK